MVLYKITPINRNYIYSLSLLLLKYYSFSLKKSKHNSHYKAHLFCSHTLRATLNQLGLKAGP